MYYEARVSLADQAQSIGRGAKDHDAIQFALNDSITLRNGPPSQIIVAVYRVTGTDRDLAYVTTLRQYWLDVS